MSPVEKANYIADFLPLRIPYKGEMITFTVKRTYDINTDTGTLETAKEPVPFIEDDEYFDGGDFQTASIKCESDYVPPRPGINIIVQGKAKAPGGKPVPSFYVQVKIGNFVRKLKIIGNRKCIYQKPKKFNKKDPTKTEYSLPKFTEPEAIKELELRYEYAYGGRSFIVPLFPEAYAEAKQKALDKQKAKEEDKKKKEEEAKKEEEKKQEENKKSEEEKNNQSADEVPKLDDSELDNEDNPEDYEQFLKADDSAPSDGTQILNLSDVEKELAAEKAKMQADKENSVLDDEGTKKINGDQIEVVEESDWEKKYQQKPEKDNNENEEKPEEEESPFDEIYCPSNPVGKGFAFGNFPETIDGLELPNIEDPDDPITPENLIVDSDNLLSTRVPAGFSWYSNNWLPRSGYAGFDPEQKEKTQEIMDDYMLEKDPENEDDRQEIEALMNMELPDFNELYYNSAHPKMVAENKDIIGNEEVLITNMAETDIYFKLAGHHPLLTIDRGRGDEPVHTELDTIYMNTEEKQCVLYWRGAIHYKGPEMFMEYPKFELDIQDMDIAEYRSNLAVKKSRDGYDDQGVKFIEDDTKEKVEVEEEEISELKSTTFDPDAKKKTKKSDEDDAKILRDDGENLLYDDDWIDEEKKRKYEELGMAEELKELEKKEAKKQKKEALKKKLEELKAMEEQKKK